MKSDVTKDIKDQTILIQHIIDTMSVTDCYNYFSNNFDDATANSDSYFQGIYSYALSSLFYKHEMYTEAIENAKNALEYFKKNSEYNEAHRYSLLWELLDKAFIHCKVGEVNKATAYLEEYESYQVNDLSYHDNYYTLLKIRIAQLNGSLKNNFNLVNELFNKKDYVIISREYIEYLNIFEYILTDGPISLAKKLLDFIGIFCEKNAPKRAVRKYHAARTNYYFQIGDMQSFEESFLLYEDSTISRQDKFKKSRLETIYNEEKIFNQKQIQKTMTNEINALQKSSFTDPLTQLSNRYHFDEYSREVFERSKSNNHTIGLIIIDIDHFKQYNDTYGHMTGDQCLTLVGQVMSEVFEKYFIARYGGDEFVAIFENVPLETICDYASKLNAALKKRTFITYEGKPFAHNITVSQGIICDIPKENQTLAEFIDLADKALYDAKHTSRDTFKYAK